MSRTDQQEMAEISTHIDRFWQAMVQYERQWVSQNETYRALRNAYNNNDLNGVRTLRREFEKRQQATQSVSAKLDKLIIALLNALAGWRSPGRDFVRFKEKAVKFFNRYTKSIEEIRQLAKDQREFVNQIFK